MNQDDIRAQFAAHISAPIIRSVSELERYIKKLWGHGETDEEVRAWLHERGPMLGDDRGLAAWEDVLDGETSDDDLVLLVYAACQFDLEPLDGAKASEWLTERLEQVRGSL